MLSFIRKVLIWLVLLCLAIIFIKIYQEKPITSKEKPRTPSHRDFVASCINGGATDDLCDCMYRDFQYRFGDANLHKLNTPKPDRQTIASLKLSIKRCERNARLESTQSQQSMLKYQHEN